MEKRDPRIPPKTLRDRWVVDVDVYLESIDPLRFIVESYLQQAHGGDLVFHNNGHPGFDVAFHLHDDTDDPDGYTFVRPRQNAIWSQYGESEAACPTTAIWEVFRPLRLVDGGMTLVVYNPNDEIKDFQYTLRVTNGGEPVRLDPGGKNMNGVSGRW